MSNVVEEEQLEDENSVKEGSYFSARQNQDKNSGKVTFTEEGEAVKDSISHNDL